MDNDLIKSNKRVFKMNLYDKLSCEYGSNVVWKDKSGMNFCIGNNLDELSDEILLNLQDDNFRTVHAHGELINCVVVQDLDKLTEKQIEMLKEFTGSNCYTDE